MNDPLTFLRFICLFTYSKIRATETEEKRQTVNDMFHLLVCMFPKYLQWLGLGQAKRSSQEFHWGRLCRWLRPSSAALQAIRREPDQKCNSWDINQHPYGTLVSLMDALTCGWSHNADPKKHFILPYSSHLTVLAPYHRHTHVHANTHACLHTQTNANGWAAIIKIIIILIK